MNCLGKIFWGIIFLIFVASLIWAFSLVVIVVFGAILISGIFSLLISKEKLKQKKKGKSVSSRSIGHIEKDGSVQIDQLQGFDIVVDPNKKRKKK